MLVYVDDIIITGNSHKLFELFIKQPHNFFALKDLGSLYHFLRIEAYRDDTGLYLKQEKYFWMFYADLI